MKSLCMRTFAAAIWTTVVLAGTPAAAASQDATRHVEPDLTAVDEYLQALIDEGALPGASFMVFHRGRPLHATALGWADLEQRRPLTQASVFRLASATKIFISTAFMTLVEDGTVSLDDPVDRWIPEFAGVQVGGSDGPVPPRAPITVLDLLRHTAGLGYGYDDPYQQALEDAQLVETGVRLSMDWTHPWTLDEWAARLAAVPLEGQPGTAFSYGLTHDLLGLLIERASGMPLDRFVDERLVQPLGLEGTGFVVPASRAADLTSFYLFEDDELALLESADDSPFHSRPRAASGGGGWDQLGNGGMVSTLADFARLLRALANEGQVDGVRILEAETVDVMMQNHLSGIGEGDSYWPGVGFGFGYAYLYDPTRYDGPGGAGTIWWAGSTNVYFWMDPENEIIGVFMTHVLPFGHLDVMTGVQELTYEALE